MISASVKADFGAAFLIRTTWTTTVTAAVAQCVAPATTSASRIGRASLAALLGSLTAQIGQLAAQPGSAELGRRYFRVWTTCKHSSTRRFVSAGGRICIGAKRA